jgi:hypothetical protein
MDRHVVLNLRASWWGAEHPFERIAKATDRFEPGAERRTIDPVPRVETLEGMASRAERAKL